MLTGIQLTAPKRVAASPMEEPDCREGDALLRILAVGICGSDLHIFREGHIGTVAAAYPFVLGHEAVGVVESVTGPEGSHLVGKRVSIEPTIFCRECEQCLGGSPNLCTNQSFVSLPPVDGLLRQRVSHRTYLLEEVPASLSDAAATLLEPLAVALSTLDLLHARPGVPLAITGCGPLGLTTLILARAMCIGPILCVDPLPHRRQAAINLGADAAVAPAEAVACAASLAGVHGFPLVAEASGSGQAQAQCAELAGPGGRIAIIGTNIDDSVALPGHTARRKGLSLFMVRRSRNTLKRCCVLAARPEIAQSMEAMISHIFAPEEAQQAFDTASGYLDGALKVVLRMQPVRS